MDSDESLSPDKETLSEALTGEEEEEEEGVFPYDDNIPSIPSIPTLSELPAKNGPVAAYRRRNMLLRMISDPKCYNPRVLKSLCHDKRQRSEAQGQQPRMGAAIADGGQPHAKGEETKGQSGGDKL